MKKPFTYLSSYARAAALAVLPAVLLPMHGCLPAEGGKSGENGKIVLTVWETYNNQEHTMFLDICRRFEKEYLRRHGRGIEIKVGRVPFDGLLPKLKTACQTHTTPDICRVDCAHVVALAYGKAVVPLDSIRGFPFRSAEEARRVFVRAAMDSNIVTVPGGDGEREEHIFGLPDQTTCVALFWNRSLFRERAPLLEAAGLSAERAPRTWEEFVEYGKLLSQPSRKIYAFAMTNSLWWTFPFFFTFGAEFTRTLPDGRLACALDSPQAQAALSFKVDLYRKRYEVAGRTVRIEAGAWIPGAISKETGFINQTYAMILSGPWNLRTFRKAGIDFRVSLVPAGPEGTSSVVGGTNLVMFRSCRNREAAAEFMLYVTSREVQRRWCSELEQIPVRQDVFPLVDVSGNPEMAVFFEQIKTARSRPQLPRYDLLEEIVNPQMELALKGEKSVKEALAYAVRRINREVLSLVNER